MSPQRWETSLSYWFMVRTVRACSSGNPCFLPKLDCQSHSCRDNWRASTWWYLLFPSKKSNLAKTYCARKSFLSWNWHHWPRIDHYYSSSNPRPTFGSFLQRYDSVCFFQTWLYDNSYCSLPKHQRCLLLSSSNLFRQLLQVIPTISLQVNFHHL